MFILEEPYVSNLMKQTLINNNFKVYDNKIARLISDKFNFTTDLNNKIYSNSENSIGIVAQTDENSDLNSMIAVCKDKYEFRNRLMNLYPDFFFEEIPIEDLEDLDITDFPMPFIIKPTVGFLSMGVHKVNSLDEWQSVLTQIQNEIINFKSAFPENVLSSTSFIVEEAIEGDEYAIDAYYDADGNPVIMNIFRHPFNGGGDVSDRIYLTSKNIIKEHLAEFQKLLIQIGKNLCFKNFPIHIEVRKRDDGVIIPIEINPMRFAGWCTTDIMYYTYGINPYEYFENKLKPDWEKIFDDISDDTFYFAMAETPSDIDKSNIKFDYNKFMSEFSNILEFRKINYTEKPLFAMWFGNVKDEFEINKILNVNMSDYITRE